MQHSYGAIGAPSVDHHRWQPLSRRSISTGRGRFNRTARVLLHEMRWRPAPRQYVLRTVATLASLLLHLVVFAAMLLVQPLAYELTPSASTDAIEVRLIEPEAPPPPPPPPPQVQSLAHVRAEAKAARAAAQPVPQRAPQLQPIPLPAQAASRISLELKPTAAVPPPGAPQPLQRPQARPPVPVMPAIAAPPPPKVVLEPSKMAVPPPPLQVEQVQPGTVVSTRLQPVPEPNPQTLTGAPRLSVTVPDALPASAQPVQRPQPVSPSPAMAEIPLPAEAVPNVTLEATPAPQVKTQALPSAPAMRAADAALAPVPVAPQAAPVPQVDVQSIQSRVVDVPVQAPALPAVQTATQAPAASAPANTSAAASWVRPSDQFAPAPEHSANGKANPLNRYSRNGKPSASPLARGTHGAGAPGGAGTQPGYVQLYPHGNSNVMGRNTSRIEYHPTLFEQYWVPANESALDSLLRRFVEKFTYQHVFDLGDGVRVKCVVGPLAIFAGCGGADPPRQKSAKSDDVRLNMAPANPLVPGLGEPAPTAAASSPPPGNEVQCEVARVAGGPPPPGCPGAPIQPSKSDQW
jgi:hypothetical protein